jgi:hypothetical protein
VGVSKKKNTQKNDSRSERKSFEETVHDITDDVKEKLGIEEMVVTTVHIDERKEFWAVSPSLHSDGWTVASGDLVLSVGSISGAKSLIFALEYAAEMLELNGD